MFEDKDYNKNINLHNLIRKNKINRLESISVIDPDHRHKHNRYRSKVEIKIYRIAG